MAPHHSDPWTQSSLLDLEIQTDSDAEAGGTTLVKDSAENTNIDFD